MRLAMEWALLGEAMMDAENKLALPKADRRPALYRFAITFSDGQPQQQYIGESANLARRFANYRGPGPTQQTSQRINKVLKEALAIGARIEVFVMREGAWLETGDARTPADLSSKVVRCLLENAAILTQDAGGAVILNLASKQAAQ